MYSFVAGEKPLLATSRFPQLQQSNSASAYLIPCRELTEAGINPHTDLKVRFSAP